MSLNQEASAFATPTPTPGNIDDRQSQSDFGHIHEYSTDGSSNGKTSQNGAPLPTAISPVSVGAEQSALESEGASVRRVDDADEGNQGSAKEDAQPDEGLADLQTFSSRISSSRISPAPPPPPPSSGMQSPLSPQSCTSALSPLPTPVSSFAPKRMHPGHARNLSSGSLQGVTRSHTLGSTRTLSLSDAKKSAARASVNSTLASKPVQTPLMSPRDDSHKAKSPPAVPLIPRTNSYAASQDSASESASNAPSRPICMFSDDEGSVFSDVEMRSPSLADSLGRVASRFTAPAPAPASICSPLSSEKQELRGDDDFNWEGHCKQGSWVSSVILASVFAGAAVGACVAVTHEPPPCSDEQSDTAVEILIDSDTPENTPPHSPSQHVQHLSASALEAASSMYTVNSCLTPNAEAEQELERALQRERMLLEEIDKLKEKDAANDLQKQKTEDNNNTPERGVTFDAPGLESEDGYQTDIVRIRMSNNTVIPLSIRTREGDWLISEAPDREMLPEEFVAAQLKEYSFIRNICVVCGLVVFPCVYPFLKSLPLKSGAQKGVAINLACVSLICFTLTIVFFSQSGRKIVGASFLGAFFLFLFIAYYTYTRGRMKKRRFLGKEAESVAKVRSARKEKQRRVHVVPPALKEMMRKKKEEKEV